jgi:hypothetical protein
MVPSAGGGEYSVILLSGSLNIMCIFRLNIVTVWAIGAFWNTLSSCSFFM